ncbi:PTS lactose/cellobiose transporter subunit IIA [Streptococcus pneumoniae]|nr:PTS lactose/cellobiose transporter subunit IIA [Streptococcus pneumoniae]
MTEVNLESIMGLIMNSGEAKSNAMEAIAAAKKKDFNLASSELEKAQASLIKAHKSQTDLLTREAQGDKIELTLLTVHSQDHLMTAITFVDLAKEIVALYQSR